MFLVRKGNPKGIKDWDDLVKPGVQVITPNPKTSGGARWNYLAAWGYALRAAGQRRGQGARSSSRGIFKNVPVLDTGARGSTITFVAARHRRRAAGLGERGVPRRSRNWAPTSSRSSCPRVSILAEPPVAVVDKVVDKHGTRERRRGLPRTTSTPARARDRRQALLPPAQPEHRRAEDLERFPKVELFTIDEMFGGWQKAQKKHFADGGIFDQIYSQDK